MKPYIPEKTFSDEGDIETTPTSEKANQPQIRVNICASSFILSHEHEKGEVESFKSRIVKNAAEELGDANFFKDTRKAELQGLLDRGVFVPVHISEAKGHRIFGGRFVDEIKNVDTQNEKKKSRFVVQAFQDKKHGRMTHSPTVQRSSQRLLLCLAAMTPELQFFTRDISQAYTQSDTRMKRPVFVKAPKELGLSDDMVLRVDLPLYGIPEAGVHWFLHINPIIRRTYP